jgi:hypothetical protein
MKQKKVKETEKPVKYYNCVEISYILGTYPKEIRNRIKELKIFPDVIIGKSKCYNMDKVNIIMAFKRYEKKEEFLIFESRLNYETE